MGCHNCESGDGLMTDYDIGKAFQAIEDELIASMIRNMKSHRAWEDEEGFHWEQWQVLQLSLIHISEPTRP